LEFVKAGEGQKRRTTIAKEAYALRGWADFMGSIRVDNFRMTHVNAYKAKRLNAGLSPRTVNLDVIALNAVLKHALDEKWIKSLPTANLHPLKYIAKQRPLFTAADLDRLCAAAMETKPDGAPVTKNGAELVDFLRLLAYSGAREQEALALRWRDVDFERGHVTVGAAISTKNGEVRTVDFNPKLRSHLEQMAARQAPDSQWLFPSPQRGDKDIHAKTLRESLNRARSHAGMARIAFHDCRHHFISMGVMASVDFMTIASWVGHRDGGVLIGKVYGHLADTHNKAMAARLNFEVAVSPDVTA
jgi:integrase